MDDGVKGFLSKFGWVAVIAFIILYKLLNPVSTYDFFGCIAESITVSILILTAYEKWIWMHNPLEPTPRLGGIYDGEIDYCYDGVSGRKSATININQSLFRTSVGIVTDESNSNSISSKLVLENGEYILYYTYITNPKSKFSKDNPIQYGTCRLMIETNGCLSGTYWTSRQTIGDIHLTKRN